MASWLALDLWQLPGPDVQTQPPVGVGSIDDLLERGWRVGERGWTDCINSELVPAKVINLPLGRPAPLLLLYPSSPTPWADFFFAFLLA